MQASHGCPAAGIASPCFCHLLQDRIFIVGPHGGKSDTVKVVNFTEHIQEVFARYPDATSPAIPYTELLFTTNPGYRKHIRIKGGLPLIISKRGHCHACWAMDLRGPGSFSNQNTLWPCSGAKL